MDERIDPDHIERPERCAFWPADHRACHGIDFADRVPAFHHLPHGDKQAVCTDAVANKVWRIFCKHDTFSEHIFAELFHK